MARLIFAVHICQTHPTRVLRWFLQESTVKQLFKVDGMTCGHCVRAVTQAITQADPQALVEVDLAGGHVQVESSLAAQTVADLIEEEGYAARPA
jgi:copper chaperone